MIPYIPKYPKLYVFPLLLSLSPHFFAHFSLPSLAIPTLTQLRSNSMSTSSIRRSYHITI